MKTIIANPFAKQVKCILFIAFRYLLCVMQSWLAADILFPVIRYSHQNVANRLLHGGDANGDDVDDIVVCACAASGQ